MVAPHGRGQWVLIFPMLLGVLLYARYVPQYSYLNRLPLSLMMGAGAGVAMRGAVESQIVGQPRQPWSS